MASSKTGFRRTRWTAVATGGLVVATVIATSGWGAPASAASDAEPGIGTAIAESYKLDPKAGGLTVGLTLGRAIAAHQNTVAQASSQAIDLGVIGTTAAAQGCDGKPGSVPDKQQPHAMQVDSRDDRSTRSDNDYGFDRFVSAGKTPFAEARTTAAPFGIQGIAQFGPGVAHTTSGLVNGERVTEATFDLASLDLIAGLASQVGAPVVHLDGLHWQSRVPSTGTEKPTASFSIGHMSIAGTPTPTADPTAALLAANQVLKNVGLQIAAPKVRKLGRTLYVVDPLGLQVVPNAQRDQVAGGVLKGIQPLRASVVGALLKAKCTLSTEITILDIAVGSVTGAGSFGLYVGGVQASSDKTPPLFGDFNGDFGGGLGGGFGSGGGFTPPPVSSTPDLPTSFPSTGGGSTDVAGSGLDNPGSGEVALPPSANRSTVSRPIADAVTSPLGSRGGALALVGGLGLGMLLLAAEGDRRAIRQAKRNVVFQD